VGLASPSSCSPCSMGPSTRGAGSTSGFTRYVLPAADLLQQQQLPCGLLLTDMCALDFVHSRIWIRAGGDSSCDAPTPSCGTSFLKKKTLTPVLLKQFCGTISEQQVIRTFIFIFYCSGFGASALDTKTKSAGCSDPKA
jgi:hypothetical protein